MYKLPKFHDELYEASWSEKCVCVCVCVCVNWQRMGTTAKIRSFAETGKNAACVCVPWFFKKIVHFYLNWGKTKI